MKRIDYNCFYSVELASFRGPRSASGCLQYSTVTASDRKLGEGLGTRLVVSEPDPRKIGKEGLAHRLGWKCYTAEC